MRNFRCLNVCLFLNDAITEHIVTYAAPFYSRRTFAEMRMGTNIKLYLVYCMYNSTGRNISLENFCLLNSALLIESQCVF